MPVERNRKVIPKGFSRCSTCRAEIALYGDDADDPDGWVHVLSPAFPAGDEWYAHRPTL